MFSVLFVSLASSRGTDLSLMADYFYLSPGILSY